MKKVIIALTAIIAMASCKKEDVVIQTSPATTKDLVKSTYVWDNGTPEINDFTYDAAGRISMQKNETRTYTFNYVSATSLIVTERKTTDNSLHQTIDCNLNDKGYITNMVYKNPAGTVTYKYTYTYNADGYVIRLEGATPAAGGYEVDYTIVNGNAVASKNYNNGVLNYSGEYTYDNSKTNKTIAGYAGNWPSLTLFGKRSKNHLVDYKAKNPAGTITWHTQYAYEMDAAGYPVKMTTSNVLSGKQGVDTYIYQ
jgi:hypothetical protein